MDRRFVLTVAALILVVAGSAALAVRLPKNSPSDPLFEAVPGVEKSQPSPQDTPSISQEQEFAYLVKEYDGRVAVFPYSDQSEPDMVLDTLVKFLPDYDRTQMKQGIPVKNDRELVALIEDFIS